jgi:hypothetical protein
LTTHHADSYLRTTLPRSGKYYVHLGDNQRNGGPEFGYRLRLSAPQPDFALRLVPSSITVRSGATIPLAVFALRKDGFTNAITLALESAPTGFHLSGATVPAGQDKIRFTLTVPPTPTDEPLSLEFIGRVSAAGREVIRPVIPADDLMQAFIYRHLVPAKELKLVISSRGMQRASPRILTTAPLRIPAGGTARLKVGAPGLTERFQLELSDPPEGISIQNVSPSREGAEIELAADAEKVKPGMGGNVMPAIPFEIISAQ